MVVKIHFIERRETPSRPFASPAFKPDFITCPFVLGREDGQSILEFLFSLPLMIGMTILLIHVNQTIQVSIVNQQYARAQAHFLTFNSPFYPEIKFKQTLVNRVQNQLVVGVSSDSAPEDSGSDYSPSAPVVNVTRTKAQAALAPDDPQDEPSSRAKVRVRNTVTLCADDVFLGGAQPVQIQPIQGSEASGFQAAKPNQLSQGSTFDNFCFSKLKYIYEQ